MHQQTDHALFELEQCIKAFDDLAYAISDDGTGHPPWIDTIKQHVERLRAAFEADIAATLMLSSTVKPTA